jgi:hypothetical protein
MPKVATLNLHPTRICCRFKKSTARTQSRSSKRVKVTLLKWMIFILSAGPISRIKKKILIRIIFLKYKRGLQRPNWTRKLSRSEVALSSFQTKKQTRRLVNCLSKKLMKK